MLNAKPAIWAALPVQIIVLAQAVRVLWCQELCLYAIVQMVLKIILYFLCIITSRLFFLQRYYLMPILCISMPLLH
jgi:hypothetical protein